MSLDESLDIGEDTGTPVSEDHKVLVAIEFVDSSRDLSDRLHADRVVERTGFRQDGQGPSAIRRPHRDASRLSYCPLAFFEPIRLTRVGCIDCAKQSLGKGNEM